MFGNIANTHYRMAKVLRAHGPFDMHLYIDRRHHATMLPENDDPEVLGTDPPWIHRADVLGPRRYLAPWTSPLVHELDRYDLVIASGEGPIFAQFTRRPWAFLVTGSDLTMLPFPLRFRARHRTARAWAANLVLALWQRRAIRRATEIWSQPFRPMTEALARLGVAASRVSAEYFPVPVGDDLRGPVADDPATARLRGEHDFVVFHPSRLMIRATEALRSAGQWKRNDLLVRAFAAFVRLGNASSPVLVMLDRPDSPDVPVARALIRDLGIERNVRWIRPARAAGLTRAEMRSYYRISDAVADDFGVGWFGAIALEALALGRPVVTYVDEDAMRRLYPWHPMLSASTEEGVRDLLVRLHGGPAWREAVARRGVEWIEAYHSDPAVGSRYVSNLRAIAARYGLSSRTAP